MPVSWRRLDNDDRRRGQIIEKLMCNFSVDLATIAPGVDFGRELSLLAPMIADGIVEVESSRLTVTEVGRPIVRVVAAAFDTYRRPEAAQFSKAV
jgi:oxygen-independent coproporphyrinogen III oxidase